ncbi:exonuclease domain-containing protein [Alteromonas stellipolaris]|uniref:Exonuclease domain-containing protein n=1 Tax=Alteromonas stellipolaris TaxID=233316 RepID=A0AAW7YXA4_9ALTE|nr:exonuclease domain-containing protein [Alteromonas stellipolaris]MDO6576816.1 exonuclease domain-containing protein [Alteromonas stellipolaris]
MRKDLPPRYYLAHFFEFLAFFKGANAALLSDNARDFIESFNQLDADKQCIIVRAANRKYAVIDRSQFSYAEIANPQYQIDELVDANWFGDLQHASLQDIAGVLTKDAILKLLSEYGATQGLASLTKPVLVSRLEACINQHGWPEGLNEHTYLVCLFDAPLKFLLFLYFGNTKGRLNQFSMRDLGVMRTRGDSVSDITRFDSKADAEAAWFFANHLEKLPFLSISQANALAQETFPNSDGVSAMFYRDQFLYALALKLLGEYREQALLLLSSADSDKAKEKWIRESYKDGNVDSVKEALELIIDSPPSDTLLAFAEDFYARKYHKKRTSAVTDMLRNASRTIDIDVSQNQQVERGVLAHYKRLGIAGWRTENRLWRSLFGLTFWAQLYEEDTLVTEFDRRPLSLKQNNFYARFGSSIEALFERLDGKEKFRHHVHKMATAHYGKVNSLFMWSSHLLEPIDALIKHGELSAIVNLLRMMSEDFASLSDGFPDIMVFDEKLRFEEVKAPGDQLRRNQLVSIQGLQRAGFEVAVTTVNWHRDPNQPYVVVDIETTGGNNSYNRITEIGMVKIVAGEVVDTYQTLINPQRRIPATITRLTGISDDMVADAPLFVEVAESIASFTDEAVFVAHNVNFDYGFIKQEFARLELPFKRPKLCTVREMRKVNPGLPSYSLANLTRHFDIKMEQHHRALSDAKAAAALLDIILTMSAGKIK